MPGGPRGLQNRRRRVSGEVGSIPILSATPFLIFDCRFSIGRKIRPAYRIEHQTLNIEYREGGEPDVA